jgi:hypothetical protein
VGLDAVEIWDTLGGESVVAGGGESVAAGGV